MIVALSISGLVALVLYKLISPSSGSQTSFTYARKWTAYIAAISIFPPLGMFILNDSGDNLTKIVVAIVLWIPTFLLGWMYGAWKMRKPLSTATKISNEEVSITIPTKPDEQTVSATRKDEEPEPAQTNDQPINDNDLYLKATLEVDANAQEPALWAKAMALCEGDKGKAKYKYINLRVEYLTNNPIKETLEDAPLATEQSISDHAEESKKSIERLFEDAQKSVESKIIGNSIHDAEQATESLLDNGYTVSIKDYGWLIISHLGEKKEITSIEELCEYATSKR
jgi:hypothetical protein